MNKTYFLYFSYFATGEGWTDSFGVFGGKDENEAIIDFLEEKICKKHDYPDWSEADHQKSLEYWKKAVSVIVEIKGKETEWAQIKDILSSYLAPELALSARKTMEDGALFYLSFHRHFNYL